MRVLAVISCLTLSVVSVADPPNAAAAIAHHINIPPQKLGPALRALARSQGFQIVYGSKEVSQLDSPGAVGEFTPTQALEQLLSGTGLTYRYVDDKTITIVSPTATSTSQAPRPTTGDATTRIDTHSKQQEARSPSFWDRFRLARVDQGAAAQGGSLGAGATSHGEPTPVGLEEIVVTAQKRDEKLQEVPVSVTAVSADTLVTGGQHRLEEYYNKIPGLSLTQVDDGFTSVAIRGVTAGGIGSSPTVGTVIDDIPFGASFVVNGFQESLSDFDPSELTRVEVLRGPQGTLYGASSMGGLIKYVTVDPSTDRLSGLVRAGGSGVSHGNEGYDVLGAVNVPLSDTFAMRVSGSARRDPGYIDNIFSSQNDVNWLDSRTGRIVGLWKPTNDLSVKVSALYQYSRRGGSSEVDLPNRVTEVAPTNALASCPVPVGLQQCDLPDTGWQKQEFQAYSAIVTQHWGAAELTSLTGYSIKKIDNLQDYTPALGALAQGLFSVGGFTIGGPNRMTKLSQELRFSAPLGSRIDWMLGLFYTREAGHTPYVFQAVDPKTMIPSAVSVPPTGGLPGGLAYEGDDPQGYKEYAVFTDFTFRITDRFDVQLGGRESHNRLNYSNSSTGIFNQLLGQEFHHVQPELTSTDNPFTYLFSPRFRFSPDLMVYGRLASGYRPGGFNINPVIRAQGHPDFTHDTTQSYELGTKGAAFGRLLTFDVSVYYIDWKDIQLQLTDPADVTVKYTLNAGSAVSQGSEVALTLHPISRLDISAWADFNDATLTSVPSNTALAAKPGDRLPYSARWSGGLSVDQKFPLTTDVDGFVGASMTYVGDRKGQFLTGDLTQIQGIFPAYIQFDLNGGITLSDTWKIDAFINNVADRRGVLRNGHDSLMGLDYRVTYIRPRSFGISLTRSF